MADALFFAGVPTKPDVQKIRERWPVESLQPGTTIPYESVAEVISVSVKSHRFKTVTNSWRKSVEPDLFIAAPGGGVFEVLSPSGKVDLATSKMRTAGRMVRRSVTVSETVDRAALDEEAKSKLDRLQGRQAAIRAALQQKGNGTALPSLTAE